MGDLRDICVKLDEVLVEFFETLDELYNEQKQLEITLKQGHLYMAKARYSMGASAVGQLQYNEDDLEEALYHVKINDDEDSCNVFELVNTQLSSGDNHNQDEGAVRKRNKPNNSDHSPELETSSRDGFEVVQRREKETCGSRRKDPIKWFGVLVPQPLRQSQEKFKSGVELACSVANLQKRLLAAKERFRELHKQKQIIVNNVLPGQGESDIK